MRTITRTIAALAVTGILGVAGVTAASAGTVYGGGPGSWGYCGDNGNGLPPGTGSYSPSRYSLR